MVSTFMLDIYPRNMSAVFRFKSKIIALQIILFTGSDIFISL